MYRVGWARVSDIEDTLYKGIGFIGFLSRQPLDMPSFFSHSKMACLSPILKPREVSIHPSLKTMRCACFQKMLSYTKRHGSMRTYKKGFRHINIPLTLEPPSRCNSAAQTSKYHRFSGIKPACLAPSKLAGVPQDKAAIALAIDLCLLPLVNRWAGAPSPSLRWSRSW